MTFFTATQASRPSVGFFAFIAGGISTAFHRVVEAQDRSPQVRRLEALSDEELAAKGIARTDIVRYVFRDIYGL